MGRKSKNKQQRQAAASKSPKKTASNPANVKSKPTRTTLTEWVGILDSNPVSEMAVLTWVEPKSDFILATDSGSIEDTLQNAQFSLREAISKYCPNPSPVPNRLRVNVPELASALREQLSKVLPDTEIIVGATPEAAEFRRMILRELEPDELEPDELDLDELHESFLNPQADGSYGDEYDELFDAWVDLGPILPRIAIPEDYLLRYSGVHGEDPRFILLASTPVPAIASFSRQAEAPKFRELLRQIQDREPVLKDLPSRESFCIVWMPLENCSDEFKHSCEDLIFFPSSETSADSKATRSNIRVPRIFSGDPRLPPNDENLVNHLHFVSLGLIELSKRSEVLPKLTENPLFATKFSVDVGDFEMDIVFSLTKSR